MSKLAKVMSIYKSCNSYEQKEVVINWANKVLKSLDLMELRIYAKYADGIIDFGTYIKSVSNLKES